MLNSNLGMGLDSNFWSYIVGFLIKGIICSFIFKKAGRNPWHAVIPLYGPYVLCDIALGVSWVSWVYGLLSISDFVSFGGPLVQFARLVVLVILDLHLAKKFGKSTGFAIGLIILPFIFYPILAFGEAQYISDNNMKDQKQNTKDGQAYNNYNEISNEIPNNVRYTDSKINSDEDNDNDDQKS